MGGDFASDKKTKKPGFFSRIFGGKKKDDTANAQNFGSNSENEGRVRGGNFKEITQNFYKFGVTEVSDLFEIGKKLGNSYKLGRKGNSESFEAIGIMLNSLNERLSDRFSFEHKEYNDIVFDSVVSTFDTLIKLCDEYIKTHEDPKSIFGKNRKELVDKLRGIAQADKAKLESQTADFKSLNADQQSQTSFLAMLRSARTVHLHTDDFEQMRDSKATGGQASDVMKLNVNGDNVRGVRDGEKATHYFKFEDEINIDRAEWVEGTWGNMELQFNASTVIDNVLKRYPDVSSEDEKIIKQWAVTNTTGAEKQEKLPLDKLSPKGREILISVNSLMSGAKTSLEQLAFLELTKKTGTINMSNRNVATSRLAELFGVGNLVAKSENVEITDNNNRKFTGNLMESAIAGRDARGLGMELNAGKSESLVDEASKGEGYQIEIGATGAFQRDMCNLQILDCICGQVDRHSGNIIVSQDENGDLAGLQGIDNDAAFGLNEDNSFATADIKHNRSVINRETGELNLPYVDDEMARRIESISPSALEYVLKDLLAKDEINACIIRFNKIKQVIQKTRKEQPERFLKNENDWNDDTAQKMIDESWTHTGKWRKFGKNDGKTPKEKKNLSLNYQSYFGRLMSETMIPFTSGYDFGLGASPKIRRRNK